MGWLFNFDPQFGKNDLVKKKVKEFSKEDSAWQYMDHCVVSDHLWIMLREVATGVTEPILYQMAEGNEEMGWGHKCLWFKEHDDIPRTLFKQMTMVNGANRDIVEWHGRVTAIQKERTDRRKSWRALKTGCELSVNGVEYRCIQPWRQKVNFIVIERISDSSRFKLSYENWQSSFTPEAPVSGVKGFQEQMFA